MASSEENGVDVELRVVDGNLESSFRGDNAVDSETPETRVHSSGCQSEFRQKQLHSSYIFFSFMALGMVIGLHGPTFLDLLLIVDVDIERGTVLFTAGSIGYLLGSLIGGIVYDKWNKELILFLSTLLMGVLTVVLPWTRYLPAMAVVNCVRSAMMGALDTGGNAMMVKIWGKDVAPYMQAIHFAFGVGGMVSPFIAEPFLLKQPELSGNGTLGQSPHLENFTYHVVGTGQEVTFVNNSGAWPLESHNISGNITEMGDSAKHTNVYVSYIIIGVLGVLSALPYIEMFLSVKRKQSEKKTNGGAPEDVRHIPLTPVLKVTFLVLMGLFYIFYACVEDTFAGFLMTFVVVHLKWTKTKGTQITSVMWISFSVGRLFAIVISKFLTPWKMLVTDFALLGVSFLVLLLGVERSEVFGWACTAIIGIAMASIFPTGMTWADKRIMKITGKVASFLLVCASGGTMANPILVGYLFENYTPMWFVYLLFSQTVVCILNFIIMSILVVWVHKKWKDRKSRVQEEPENQPERDESSTVLESANI